MKRYIAAIQIPCLLLQLCGCYSLRDITLEEMENKEELKITMKDSSEYNLVQDIDKAKVLNNPGIYYSNEWLLNKEEETINLKTFKAIKYFNQVEGKQIKEEMKNISFGEINKVEIEEFDLGDTLLFTGITIVSISALLFLIALAGFGG